MTFEVSSALISHSVYFIRTQVESIGLAMGHDSYINRCINDAIDFEQERHTYTPILIMKVMKDFLTIIAIK